MFSSGLRWKVSVADTQANSWENECRLQAADFFKRHIVRCVWRRKAAGGNRVVNTSESKQRGLR
jgi:hypothetical protein